MLKVGACLRFRVQGSSGSPLGLTRGSSSGFYEASFKGTPIDP